MSEIDISKMNKAEVLSALFNSSKAQGLGFLQAHVDKMSEEEAQSLLDDGHTYFDYVRGRVMKIDLSGDTLQTGLYDRDNGQGAAALALGVS
ncbi:MAG: hypothetical protein V3V84_07840 [Candidatus Bathyarchaeia archaeon]